jgi:hypothetical protein
MIQAPAALPLDAPDTYPFPKSRDHLIPWSRAEQHLAEASVYWLLTVHPDGRPHVAPIWGAWLDGAFYFQGAPNSRWARNLRDNPTASIHLDGARDVVIVDGVVDHLVTDAGMAERLRHAWQEKYLVVEHPPQADTQGILRLRPRAVRAWGETMQDATRWRFDW